MQCNVHHQASCGPVEQGIRRQKKSERKRIRKQHDNQNKTDAQRLQEELFGTADGLPLLFANLGNMCDMMSCLIIARRNTACPSYMLRRNKLTAVRLGD